VKVAELTVRSPILLNQFRVVGFNSASFKKADNYRRFCFTATDGCPEWEVQKLQALKPPDKSGEKMVLFTHVPDLNDPYRKESSWEIPEKVRKMWEPLACDPKVDAIFAGHFHDSDRNLYGNTSGTRNLTVRDCVAQKTWLAPPLAIKNQEGKVPTARGLLLVKLFKTKRPEVHVYWYERPDGSTSLSKTKAQFNSPIFWIILVGLIILLLFGVFVSMIRNAATLSSE